jgi:hypothetical protein
MTEVHTKRVHAKLAPSAAHRWIACPGSVALSAGLEEVPSEFAAEGTAAHMLAEACLAGGFDTTEFKGFTIDTKAEHRRSAFIGSNKANGKTSFLVDAEMVDGVQQFVDLANELAEQSEEFEIEQRMDMTDLVPNNFGTGDAIAYRSTPTRRVTIVDLKYGKGIPVEVQENEQLLNYALGVANRYHNRGVDEVELVIVQPRAPHRDGPIRRWVTDVVTLYEFALALQAAAKRVDEPNAALVPGDHCKFCKAVAICPALKDRVFEIIDAQILDGTIMSITDPATYDTDTLAKALKNMPLVLTWYKGVEEFGHAEAIRGRMPPGFKLVGKRATRKWNDANVATEALRLVGLDDDTIFETSIRSPAQLEKELPKAHRSIIGDLATATSSGTVLAPIDDPRPEVDPQDATGFDAVEITERS